MEELIKWHDHFSVGSELIDSQHKTLIASINKLYSAFKNNNYNAIGDILNELKNYTIFHFGTEEHLFEGKNYPYTEEHIAEHQLFINQISDFELKFKAKKITLSFEMMNFLRQWLTTHILENDKKYTPYLFPNATN